MQFNSHLEKVRLMLSPFFPIRLMKNGSLHFTTIMGVCDMKYYNGTEVTCHKGHRLRPPEAVQ